MRIVVFGPAKRVGAWAGENVIDLNRVDGQIPSNLLAFIEAGSQALERAQRVIDQAGRAPDGAVQSATAVKIHAPWPGRRVLMAGANSGGHISGPGSSGYGRNESEAVRKMRELGQRGFWKVPVTAIGPDEEVEYPSRTKRLDYEGEAMIVLGTRVKNMKAADMAQYVWGVSLTNDLSIRDQKGEHPSARMAYAKNFDGSFVMGPSIVIGEGVDFQDLPIQTKVNGELRQDFSSKVMIQSFGEMLELGTQDFTFVPGDVVGGGTGAGTAMDSTPTGPDGSKATDRFLKRGDVVEVSSPKVGTLRTRIV